MEAPAYRLYTPGQVALATMLGAPIAGTILMALTFKRLGRRRAAGAALILGAIGTALACAIGWVLPDRIGYVLPSLPWVFATYYFAKGFLGPLVAAHMRAGGKNASWWAAAGIGAATGGLILLVVFLVVFGGILLFEPDPECVTFEPDDEVYYEGDATKEDAQRLGEALKELGFFGTEPGKAVYLSEGHEGIALSFVLKAGAWNEAETQQSVRTMCQYISANVFGGQPVEIRLCDDFLRVKKKLSTAP
jgi:hypothetical protein